MVAFPTGKPLQPEMLTWLSKHAVLLRSVEHTCHQYDSWPHSSDEPGEAGLHGSQQLAAALASAGEPLNLLKLQALKTDSLPVLTAACCQTLTSIDFSLCEDLLTRNLQETVAGITGLGSQLHALTLADVSALARRYRPIEDLHSLEHIPAEGSFGLHSLIRQVLPQLIGLTRLEVRQLTDARVLKYAPPQLLDLCALGVRQSRERVNLGQLTALTSLTLMPSPWLCDVSWRDDQPDDILPPNLKTLHVFTCASATPLLGLTALETLVISRRCQVPASELQSLSTLSRLTSVELGYSNIGHHYDNWLDLKPQEGSAGWGFVPGLRVLQLDVVHFEPSSNVLHHLAGLTNLTRLVWSDVWFFDGIAEDDEQDEQEGVFADPRCPAWYHTDGGLKALGNALPSSLVVVGFWDFLPFTSRDQEPWMPEHGVSEDAVMWGLMCLKEAVLALPNLKTCLFDHCLRLSAGFESRKDGYYYSEVAVKLVRILLDGDWRQPVSEEWRDEFDRAYPDFVWAPTRAVR